MELQTQQVEASSNDTEDFGQYPEFAVVLDYYNKALTAKSNMSRDLYQKKMRKALKKLTDRALLERAFKRLVAEDQANPKYL